ncbi:MAG: DUF4383 domain-containing protein [Micromonosporaceae bacterium]|jgi:hypothetical protein
MAHLPVNHPARPLLRVLVVLVGLYILTFGIAGLVASWGQPFFSREEIWVLGLRTNPAFALLSIVVGAVVAAGAVYGHNVDHFIELWGGIVFLVAGIVMMTLLRTDLNLLNFAMVNCIVSFIIGTVMLTAGMYGKEGPSELREAEEKLRHGEGPQAPPGKGMSMAEAERRTGVRRGRAGRRR